MTKRRARRESQSRPTTCVACGAAAAGYNYEAPSCYSCKAFFRRTVIEERVYEGCLKNDVCAHAEFYRQCRACRFRKCVSGGMNPRRITTLKDANANLVVQNVSSGEKVHNNQSSTSSTLSTTCIPGSSIGKEQASTSVDYRRKASTVIEQSQRRSSLSPPQDDTCEAPTASRRSPELRLVANPRQIETTFEKMMQTLIILEDAHHQLRNSIYSPQLTPELCLGEFANSSSKLGKKYELMNAQAYEPISIRLVPEEVYIKHRICMDFTQFDYKNRKLWIFQDQVYAIEFLKALPIYSSLEKSTRIILLASALTCSNFTTAYFSYSQKSCRSCYPDGGVMTWNQTILDESPDSTRFHTAVIAAMRQIQLDMREYTLLKMILVCNPMLNGLCAEAVTLLQHEKERYTKMMLSYVLSRHGVIEGPAMFAKLLSIVDLVSVLTTWQKSQHILIMAMGLQKHRAPYCEEILHSN